MKTIGLLGIGSMGEIILSGLKRAGLRIEAAEKSKDRARIIRERYGMEVREKPQEVVAKSDVVILSVKPKDVEGLFGEIREVLRRDLLVISILAGVRISYLERLAERPVKIVRAMPNICMEVEEGLIALAFGPSVEREEAEYVAGLFRPLGKVIEVEEKDMDAITALSGSGPAFVLSFLEGMVEAGVKVGLGRDLSRAICLQVMKGVVKMLEERSVHPSILRESVTSPGGTTIFGIYELEEGGLRALLMRAVEAATERSRELGEGYG